jgi:hypothetical protein
MLLKCTRENETTYYLPSQIAKISISPVYGRDDSFDLAFYVDHTMEIVRVFGSFEEAEEYLKMLYAKMNDDHSSSIFDLNA